MSMTEEQRAALAAANQEAFEKLAPHLEIGQTLLTHTICGGYVEEHVLAGIDGHWLRGFPTSDTMRLAISSAEADGTTRFASVNVTHIDRCPVEALDMHASREGPDDFPPSVAHSIEDQQFYRVRAIARSVTRRLGDGANDPLHAELAEALQILDDVAETEARWRKACAGEVEDLAA